MFFKKTVSLFLFDIKYHEFSMNYYLRVVIKWLGLFHNHFHALLTHFDDGLTALAHSRACLDAIHAVDAHRRAVGQPLNTQHTVLALQQDSLRRHVGNAVGEAFFNKHEVLPALRSLIFSDCSLRDI